MTSNWTSIGESPYPWERDAIDFIRGRFPDHEPYRAWSLFEFIALDGSVNEVDLLVFAPYGFFLVEIKGRPGRVSGDAHTWIWENDGRRSTRENPLLATNLKAKKLRSLLEHQPAFRRGKQRVPFVELLIFLSAPDQQCDLTGTALTRVCLRDREATTTSDGRTIPARPGIMAAIRQRIGPGISSFTGGSALDRPTAKLVARSLEEAGIKQSNRHRRVSDYALEQQIDEGPTYQDWQASHVSLPDTTRRVRIYPVTLQASAEDREFHRRAAVREFQILDNLDHDRILRAKQFTEHDLGPAIIFEHDPTAIRLDHFLALRDRDLTLSVRLDLIRQLAEVMKFAHKKRVIHRGLSPRSVLVLDADSERPRVKVFNWQVGYRGNAEAGATQGITATSHVGQLVDDPTTAYMAPDLLLTPAESRSEHLDVFSLGAVAYHILSGRPPASDGAELALAIRDSRGLELAAVVDGAGSSLCDLIRYATHPDVGARFESVGEFLELLDLAEEELTSPDCDLVEDATAAQVGDLLPGGLLVERRLGQGSSAVALLVSRGGGDDREDLILKVASSPEHNDRVRAEAAVLKKLNDDRDSRVVSLVEPLDIGTAAAFLMRPIFVDRSQRRIETLGARLRKEGRLHVDLLQRFGEDLIGVAAHLDRLGITHRDIKPDNIAVGLSSHESQLQIVLFDFSLVSVPQENIHAGTTGYLDPLLRLRQPTPRFDNYAERYAVAMTLHEMATGTLPKWGDGRSDPSLLDELEITIDPDLFDVGLRERLTVFFRRAFRRSLAERFDNAEQMLAEWRACFHELSVGPIVAEHDDEVDLHQQLATAALDTPVAALGLGTRATNALDRANLITAADLLAFNRTKFDRMPGVGAKTRREIVAAVRILRSRLRPDGLPSQQAAATTRVPDDTVVEPVNLDSLSLDAIAARLQGTGSRRGQAATAASVTAQLLGTAATSPEEAWPTQVAIAESVGVTRARVGQLVGKLLDKARKDPAVTSLRQELVGCVESQGGVATAAELAALLLASRGSEYEPEAALWLAAGLVRVAVDTEGQLAEPRLLSRREGRGVVIATTAELADYAVRLGRAADRLVDGPPDEPLASPARVVERLREIATVPGLPPPSDNRLVRLAAAASQQAAVSSRMELYPRNMDPLRAVKLSLGAVSGVQELAEDDLRQRIGSRYPAAAPLPPRPALDGLLTQAGLRVAYAAEAFGGRGGFRLPQFARPSVTSGSTLLSRYPTAMPLGREAAVTPQLAGARALETRLVNALRSGSFLQLVVTPRAYERAADELADRFGVVRLDVEQLVLDTLQQQAAAAGVDWRLVVATDADRGGRDWPRLERLVDRCRPAIAAGLATAGQTPLLVYADILIRYGLKSLLAELQAAIGSPTGPAGVWLLVPGSETPLLDGQPTGIPGQQAVIPEAWVRNEHRTQPASASESPA